MNFPQFGIMLWPKWMQINSFFECVCAQKNASDWCLVRPFDEVFCVHKACLASIHYQAKINFFPIGSI